MQNESADTTDKQIKQDTVGKNDIGASKMWNDFGTIKLYILPILYFSLLLKVQLSLSIIFVLFKREKEKQLLQSR